MKPRPEEQTPCHSSFSAEIICGPHRRSFAVRDHLRSNLGIISGLGIICGRGSFAALDRTPVFCWLTKWKGTFTKFCFWNLLIANETRGRVLQKNPIHLSAVLCSTACKFRLFVPCVIPAHEGPSGNYAWFILIRRWHRRHSCWQIF